MDDIGDDFDLDAELDAWLDKMAAEQGLDATDLRAAERDAIARWQQDKNPEDFDFLYNAHLPLISRAGQRYVQSTTLPKSAVKSSLLRGYVNALETYDPARAGAFSTHFYNNWVGRTGRYLQKYSNIGRIPEDRGGLIALMQQRHAALQDQLGRPPTDSELSDDMLIAAQDYPKLRDNRISPKIVGTLRKELRPDLTAESEGGSADQDQSSKMRRQIVFLHGSLNPEQQLVLEHTFGDEFGKPTVDDPVALAEQLGMSPQKIRAIKSQIAKKVERFW